MHCIIERMEYLFPPLSYLTHHSALSGLLYLSQTLYLPGSHIHMSRSHYTYRPTQHSPPLFSLSLCDTHPPNKYHNPSLHHRRKHSPPKFDYLLLAIRNTRIVSFHPYVYLDISRGIFYRAHTLSLDLPPM